MRSGAVLKPSWPWVFEPKVKRRPVEVRDIVWARPVEIFVTRTRTEGGVMHRV